VPEVSLISLLDILLGPGVVMLIYHEHPTRLQLVAGISIFLIQVLHEVYGIAFGPGAAVDLAVDVTAPCSKVVRDLDVPPDSLDHRLQQKQ